MNHKIVISKYLMVSDELFVSDGTWTICLFDGSIWNNWWDIDRPWMWLTLLLLFKVGNICTRYKL